MLQGNVQESVATTKPALKLRFSLLAGFALAAIMASLALHPAAYADTTADVQLDITYGQTEARTMLGMINDFRTGSDAWAWNSTNTEKVHWSGLGELTYDYGLERIAMQRAAEAAIMIEGTHTRPNGKACTTVTYNGRSANGENCAAGQGNATDAFVSWQEINEPYETQGHRRNMLGRDYKYVGIGHVVVNGTHYWAQEFGTTAFSTTATAADDSTQTIEIEVIDRIVDTATISDISDRRIVVAQGSSRALPVVPVTFSTINQFPSNKTNTAFVRVNDWAIADSSIAHISGDTIVGDRLGQTTLSGTAQIGDQTLHLNIPLVVATDTIEAATVSVSGTAGLTFDGYAKTPSVDAVTYQGRTLTAGVDYEVSYQDNVYPSANDAKIVITGLGSFADTSQEIHFGIAGLSFYSMLQQYYINGSGFTFNFANYHTHYYDGTPQYQGYYLRLNGTTLREGVDYYMSFKNNVYPGTATTVFNGAGLFSGALEGGSFAISKAPLSNSNICKISVPSCSYTGSAQEPPVSVKVNGNELPTSDYTVAYSNNTQVGTATVTVTAASDNTVGSGTATFQITGIDLETADGATIDSIPNQDYTGSEIRPVPVVKINGKALTAGTDYTVSYSNNTNIGTASVLITGTGNYSGAISASFEIVGKPFTGAQITVADTYYTGSAQEPTVGVTLNGATLTAGTDYTVAYQNNVNAGTATVTVTGTGNYSGKASKTFTIAPLDLQGSEHAHVAVVHMPFTYDGTEKTISPAILGDNGPIPSSDFRVEHTNNIHVGKATATVVPASQNLTGSCTLYFDIEPANLATAVTSCVGEAQDEDVTYNGQERFYNVGISTAYDGALKKDVHYTLSYSNNVNAGKATATFTGIGDYTGTYTTNYTIYAADIAKYTDVQLLQTNFIYTGSPCEPAVQVMFNGAALQPGVDYEVGYRNNINAQPLYESAPVPDVVVTGKGNFSGSYAYDFSIASANIADAVFTVNPESSLYDGSAKEPEVTGTFNGAALQRGVDYELSYDGDPSVGEHQVTISGLGNFQGSTTASYSIGDTLSIQLDGVRFDCKGLPHWRPDRCRNRCGSAGRFDHSRADRRPRCGHRCSRCAERRGAGFRADR